ncbi:YuzD family protein [Bacillus aquiflavi]|uniref:YuzD family protein n=1 Tax=Bacillus aquiflavi TaxID=2672567 RepID=A0A6B3VVS2_9BACI|nr:YuzD family protein [Bacillus aquiflavi]MBA4536011.1 YuzD family protein [Bacillus aquiflavi]NEY80385.1 YuzD family protein [Bacillus aquiflavi]
MIKKAVEVSVYGADQLCPSCVNLPSSKDTYEWLEAAISRKFPNQPFTFSYVDIFNPPNDKSKRRFAKKIIDEDLFYPLVLVEDKIVGEGNPRLKTIYHELEKYGYKAE